MKDFIEKNLQENCSIHELNKWFYPLDLFYDENTTKLTVNFPHAFFEPWFIKQGKLIFEKVVKDVGIKYFGLTPNIEYKKNKPLKIKRKNNFTSIKNVKKNQNKTFHNFFFNKKNEFNLAAAKEVAKAIAKPAYNPFVVYGNSCTGKTHILKAIYNDLLLNKNKSEVFFGTASEFYINIKELGLKKFILKYNFFIIDDFQYVDITNYFQKEIIIFVDTCIAKNKQLVFASSSNTTIKRKFMTALHSRLNAGLIIKLNEPDLDIRMRFLLAICQEEDIKISKSQMLFITQRCTNISILHGVIIKLRALKNFSAIDFDDLDIENIIYSFDDNKKSLSGKDIINITSKHFNIDRNKILENARQPQIVQARQIAMHLCRDLLGLSYSNIGRIFGGKDHSTVMYSIKKINNLIDRHKNMQEIITKIKQKCLSL